MGIDPSHLLSHWMHYNSGEELVQKLESVTGRSVLIARLSIEKQVPELLPPPDFKGWKIYTYDNSTLQDHLDAKDLIEVYDSVAEDSGTYFYFSPHLIEYNSDDTYMGRWFEVKYIADWIRENGIPSPDQYNESNNELPYIFRNRKNLFEKCREWGTSCMITFCDDKHQEWLEYFAEEKWTMEQFINWGKTNFIFVRFQDLISFVFPENIQDGYYDVFIYDDFEYLKTSISHNEL